MQKKAIFITGFNNWGKTTIIEKLFNQKRFYKTKTYAIKDLNIKETFFVETHSNDDYLGERWIDLLTKRTELKEDRNTY